MYVSFDMTSRGPYESYDGDVAEVALEDAEVVVLGVFAVAEVVVVVEEEEEDDDDEEEEEEAPKHFAGGDRKEIPVIPDAFSFRDNSQPFLRFLGPGASSSAAIEPDRGTRSDLRLPSKINKE